MKLALAVGLTLLAIALSSLATASPRDAAEYCSAIPDIPCDLALEMAESHCNNLANHETEVVMRRSGEAAQEYGFDIDQAIYSVSLAKLYFCPQYF